MQQRQALWQEYIVETDDHDVFYKLHEVWMHAWKERQIHASFPIQVCNWIFPESTCVCQAGAVGQWKLSPTDKWPLPAVFAWLSWCF